MHSTEVLVVGGTGLLGSVLVPWIRRHFSVTVIGRDSRSDFKVNVDNSDALASALDELRPRDIINLAALTDVDYCELNPSTAASKNMPV